MMAHKDSGGRCLVCHYNEDDTDASQCIRCARCGEWIRPENMDDECEGANDGE